VGWEVGGQLLVTSVIQLSSEWTVTTREYSTADSEYRLQVVGYTEEESWAAAGKFVRRTANVSQTVLA
jgi:hypothetical protein